MQIGTLACGDQQARSRARILVVLLGLTLGACGEPAPAVDAAAGSYVLDAERFAKVASEARPAERPEPADVRREMHVNLELRPDHTFSLAVGLPGLGGTETFEGTWSRAAGTVQFDVKPKPKAMNPALSVREEEGGRLLLQFGKAGVAWPLVRQR